MSSRPTSFPPPSPSHSRANEQSPAACLCVLYFFSFWLFIVSLILFVVLFISRCQSLLEVNLSFFHILPHHHSCLPPFPPHQIKSEGDLLRAPPPTLFKRGGPLSPLVAGRCHDSFVVSHIVSKSCWLDMTNTSHIYPAALWQTAV